MVRELEMKDVLRRLLSGKNDFTCFLGGKYRSNNVYYFQCALFVYVLCIFPEISVNNQQTNTTFAEFRLFPEFTGSIPVQKSQSCWFAPSKELPWHCIVLPHHLVAFARKKHSKKMSPNEDIFPSMSGFNVNNFDMINLYYT